MISLFKASAHLTDFILKRLQGENESHAVTSHGGDAPHHTWKYSSHVGENDFKAQGVSKKWCDHHAGSGSHHSMWHIPQSEAYVLQTRKGLYRLIVHMVTTHTHTHTFRGTQKYSRSHREPRNSSRTMIAAAALLFTPILKSSFACAGASLLPLFVTIF